MIYVQRTNKPVELTQEVIEKLTSEFFKDRKKPVWNQPYIKQELLKMYHEK